MTVVAVSDDYSRHSDDLKPGEYRPLSQHEIDLLNK
jgi:hypothetical protein